MINQTGVFHYSQLSLNATLIEVSHLGQVNLLDWNQIQGHVTSQNHRRFVVMFVKTFLPLAQGLLSLSLTDCNFYKHCTMTLENTWYKLVSHCFREICRILKIRQIHMEETIGFFTTSISDRKADRISARQKNSGKINLLKSCLQWDLISQQQPPLLWSLTPNHLGHGVLCWMGDLSN